MSRIRPRITPRQTGIAVALQLLVGTSAWAAASCSVRSGAQTTPVVELYTSEGCSSCPPADRWLSTLKAEPATVALAFHVDYWDRLGWTDRFASTAHTRRQAEQQRSSGARFPYTPQVIADGIDRPDWSRTPPSVTAGARPVSRVDLQLTGDGPHYTAVVTPSKNAPATLAAYWAVTEQRHVSVVKAGENGGATLVHDHVVRDYRQVPAWTVTAPGVPTTLRFDLSGNADPAHPRSVNLVVVDAATGRPVQASTVAC